jgi:hypothetical protein
MDMSHDGGDSFQLGEGGRLGVIVLACWALLCAAWNLCGAIQIAQGLRPLGPGTSLLAAAFSLALAAILILGARRGTILVLVLAMLSSVLAGLTVWNAFSLRPALWPSEFWRFVAVALNALGIGGAMLVLADAARRQLAAPGRR